jgi:hypothetical protein
LTAGTVTTPGYTGVTKNVNDVLYLDNPTGVPVTNKTIFVQGIQVGSPTFVDLLGFYPFTSGGTWHIGVNLLVTQSTSGVSGFYAYSTVNFYVLS